MLREWPNGGLRVTRDFATKQALSWERADDVLRPSPPRNVFVSPEHGDVRNQLLANEDEDCDPFDIIIAVDGEEVAIEVDPDRGPRWGVRDGDFVVVRDLLPDKAMKKTWQGLTLSEREGMLIRMAKKKKLLFQRLGRSLLKEEVAGALDDGPQKSEEELQAEARAIIEARCKVELRRKPLTWRFIEIEDVTKNHMSKGKGMFYGLEFPWTEEGLALLGPEWLTNAFHAAGTLDKDNKVLKIVMEKKVKVTTGNNGGKFLFDVRYAKKEHFLHTQLFAKIPWPCEGATRTDRLASSVNKQPQEFHEINTHRLLEATLPCRMPKFYFGDINNDTSNWILITERIPFGDRASQNYGKPKPRKGPLKPYVVEGPYDKCLDHNLRGSPRDYYALLVRTGAMMAGMYKAGKLGSRDILAVSFGNLENKGWDSWGMNFAGASGEDPRMFKHKLDAGLDFVCDTGKVVFPKYVQEEAFRERFRHSMLILNAYSAELTCWKHVNQDYIALAHVNLNVDNAYFWRNEEGQLQCGVLDWGGMGSMCLGHKLWWWLYCQDFAPLQKNIMGYIELFIDVYREYGGPALEKDILYRMMIITALQQMIGLLAAVPQIFKMCPKSSWATIENRYDPRICENVDGKSSLRQYLHNMNNIIRVHEEVDGYEQLRNWINDQWAGIFKLPPKTEEALNNPPQGTAL